MRLFELTWNIMNEVKPYQYSRFRWWREVDLDEVSKELSKEFGVDVIDLPKYEEGINLYGDEKKEIRAKADPLSARLSPFRATLYQKKAAPFTGRDLELRSKLLKIYPRNRATPFPWVPHEEPEFETTS
jgi:hypothetical protein